MRAFLSFSSAAIIMLLAGSAQAQEWVQWDTASGGNGHWYKAVINTNNLNWTQMDQIAASEGGYLATITSDAENQFVFSLINSPEFFSGNGGNGAGPAIGGYQTDGQTDPAAGWVWETGEPWSFTSWDPRQPDFLSETRLQYWSGSQGVPAPTWNNFPADASNVGGYVIERDSRNANSRSGFYGDAFAKAAGSTPSKPLHGLPTSAVVFVYDAKGRMVARVPSSPVGQFYSYQKPGDYTLVATQSKRQFPPPKLSLVLTNNPDWVTVSITVNTNALTPVEISF